LLTEEKIKKETQEKSLEAVCNGKMEKTRLEIEKCWQSQNDKTIQQLSNQHAKILSAAKKKQWVSVYTSLMSINIVYLTF